MHHQRRSRRGVLALAAVSALLVPAAIAWACNPQAQLTPNKASYTPGETMTVSGSFYPRGVPIKVAISDGQSAVATTNQSGAFQISGLRVPTAPGSYTITTTRADGQFQSGLPKVASFAIAARASRPAAPRAPAAVQQRGERTFIEPGVSRSPARSVAGGGGSGGGGGQPGVGGGGGQPGGGSTGGVAGGGTIVTGTTGVPVFAGSVAPATTFGAAPVAAQGATPSTAARSTAARSTGRAAAADSDVWSGFANGRTPSLTSDAADAPDSGTGSGLGLGIGLLAVGLLALVAGLTAAEVRRRRASA